MDINIFSAVIFDLDGTIYYGPELINGSVEAVDYFRKKGIKVFFGTNNSSKTRKTICDKLNKLGIKCDKDEVITSGFLSAVYCKQNAINDVFVCGSNELIEEFKMQNVLLNQSENASNLVIGFNKDANYADLTVALRVALHANQIIACNVERNYPGDASLLFPSCGGFVKAVEWCANRSCDFIIGKPNSYMIEYLRKEYNFDKEILVIGDSLEFDVDFAKNASAIPVCIQKNCQANCLSVNNISDIPSLFE